jgi:hypothetical protein
MEAVDICVVNVYGHQLREEYSHVDHSATAANCWSAGGSGSNVCRYEMGCPR